MDFSKVNGLKCNDVAFEQMVKKRAVLYSVLRHGGEIAMEMRAYLADKVLQIKQLNNFQNILF